MTFLRVEEAAKRPEDFITVKRAAEMMGVSLKTVRKKIRQGKLPYYREPTGYHGFRVSEYAVLEEMAKALPEIVEKDNSQGAYLGRLYGWFDDQFPAAWKNEAELRDDIAEWLVDAWDEFYVDREVKTGVGNVDLVVYSTDTQELTAVEVKHKFLSNGEWLRAAGQARGYGWGLEADRFAVASPVAPPPDVSAFLEYMEVETWIVYSMCGEMDGIEMDVRGVRGEQ